MKVTVNALALALLRRPKRGSETSKKGKEQKEMIEEKEKVNAHQIEAAVKWEYGSV
jgi:gas vesicle protein